MPVFDGMMEKQLLESHETGRRRCTGVANKIAAVERLDLLTRMELTQCHPVPGVDYIGSLEITKFVREARASATRNNIVSPKAEENDAPHTG